jgi:predicted enzyme related to lactoylglutathione lyase
MAHGTFVWNELLTRDVEAAKRFYAALVGWSYNPMPMPDGAGTYWVAQIGDKPVAGLMAMPQEMPREVPPHWFEYLEVDDVDARLKLVTEQGGKLMRPPFDVPGVGRLGFAIDSTGAVFGLMTPVQQA